MKRREFVNFVGLGMLATSLPVAIAACNPKDTVSDISSDASEDKPTEEAKAPAASEAPRADGFTVAGTVVDLDSKGSLNKKGLPVGAVVIIRDPASMENVIALNAKCTHQGCTVDWTGDEFYCACHGSTFSTDGTATVGPAVRPLEAYEATIEGETVLVKAA